MIEPLIGDERSRLRRFLDREGGPSYERARGTLHAIVSAPRLVPPSEWIGLLIGERELDEASDVQLLVRLYGEVVRAYQERELEPPPPTDRAAVEAFCAGYVRVAMADEAWRGNEEATVTCFPLLCLARGKRPSELGDFPAIHDDEGWLQEQREALAPILLAVHDLLEAQRLPAPESAPVRRIEARVGRNEPCPCGSGRKYKKCCLS